MITELGIVVAGRPAPQGSKRQGAHGQMREASVYLPAWRAAVKRAAYEEMKRRGVRPGDRPVFRGAVAFSVTFWMPADHRVDGPPDLDKLVRGVWDALTQARVWEDDSRVTEVLWLSKGIAADGWTGANILVRAAGAGE